MPSPSYLPVIVAVGQMTMFGGLLIHALMTRPPNFLPPDTFTLGLAISGIGLLTMLAGVFAWCSEPIAE